MRNCFVPGCDAHCKRTNTIQRKMFLAPTKLFEEWANVLPNKRSFKQHDRVCERHFKESDIIQFWEVNINGKVHLTPRDKPKLREDAIPTKNLPSKEDFQLLSSPKLINDESLKKRSENIEILSKTIIRSKKRLASKKTDEPIKTKIIKLIETDEEIDIVANIIPKVTTLPCLTETEKRETFSDVKSELAVEVVDTETCMEKIEMFENLFEEAFDVTLPSLLWGIHRDPDRKFIAFSEFNVTSMSMSKLFHITDTCQYKTFIGNQLKSSKTLSHELLTADHLSTLLDELEKEPLLS